MTDLERRAIHCLSRCRFAPGTFPKKFAASIERRAEETQAPFVLSPRQQATLWRCCHTFRRQIADQGVLDEAERWQAGFTGPGEQSPLFSLFPGSDSGITAIMSAIAQDQRDVVKLLILADYLEENGRSESQTVRKLWQSMADEKKQFERRYRMTHFLRMFPECLPKECIIQDWSHLAGRLQRRVKRVLREHHIDYYYDPCNRRLMIRHCSPAELNRVKMLREWLETCLPSELLFAASEPERRA